MATRIAELFNFSASDPGVLMWTNPNRSKWKMTNPSAIEKMTPRVCKKLRPLIEEALQPLAEEFGLTFTTGSGRYDSTSMTLKLGCSLAGIDPAKKEFERQCFAFGMKPEHYLNQFTHNGSLWTLVGLKVRSPKFPVIAKKISDGKQYKLPERAIHHLMPEAYSAGV